MSRLLRSLACCIVLLLGVSASAAHAAQIFSVDCEFSHRSFDDPIVKPGQPGAAHSHEFTGAWSTDAFSTPETLSRSGTSCLTNSPDKPLADKSAYWSPTLFQDGKPVAMKAMGLYISLGNKNNAGQIAALQSFPAGLRMIADMKNSYRYEAAGWGCGGTDNKTYGITPGPEIQACPNGLQNGIVFPDCWDGVHLDSADHRSHVAYALDNGDCPSTHPVYMPSLFIKHIYDSKGDGGGYTVAEGAGGGGGWTGSFHADFVNAWDQDQLNYLVRYCLKEGRAEFSTRPCLGPQLTQSETATAESLRTNANSPEPTPAPPPEPTPAPPPVPPPPAPDPITGPLWSLGPLTLSRIGEEVAIPDVLGSDTTYSMRTTSTPTGTAKGDRVVMMLGNTAQDQARIFVNGTKAKAEIFVAGVVTSLVSTRFTAGLPHDFALVRDGNTARMYIDGALAQTATLTNAAAHDLGPGALGASRDGAVFYAQAFGIYGGAQVHADALTFAAAAAASSL